MDSGSQNNSGFKYLISMHENKKLLIILFVLIIGCFAGFFIYNIFASDDKPNSNSQDNPKNNGSTLTFKINDSKESVIYTCKSKDCIQFEQDESLYMNSVSSLIYDNEYLLFNYKTKNTQKLSIPKGDYEYATIINDKNENPVVIFLEKNDKNKFVNTLYSIKNDKTIIDFDDFIIENSLVEENFDRYLLLGYKELYTVYSVKDEKIVLEKKKSIGFAKIFMSEDKVYFINSYQGYAGGDVSIEEVSTIDGKVIFKNNVKYKETPGGDISNYNELDYNYAVFDEKNHQIIIVDNHNKVFMIYDKNYNLVKKSKEYTNIVPYNNDERFYGHSVFFPSTNNQYLVVNDSGSLKVIDYSEKVIATMATINSNYKFNYVESNTDKNNMIKVFIEDKTLRVDDFTDTEMKKIDDSMNRQELLRNYQIGLIKLGYQYIYNIATNKVEKNKYFYYDE